MKILGRKTIVYVMGLLLALMLAPSVAFGDNATTKLTSMHEIDSDGVAVMEDAITDSYGKTYSTNVLRFDTGDDAFISYDLNGAYKEFAGSIVSSTDTGSDATMSVGIFADGEKLYELKGHTRQKAAESFKLDVTGVGTLSIKTTKTGGWDGYLFFVDSSFTANDSAVSYPHRASLSDLVIIDSKYSNTSDRLFVDSFGNVHNGSTELICGDDAYALYNLDKKYVTFTGCIVAGNRTGSDASMNVSFLLDDKQIYDKQKITKNSSQIDFEIDVTNASVLKIVTSKDDGWDTYIYVAGTTLKEHEHTPGDWNEDKKATCTEDGEKSRKCTECGEVLESEKIPALGHKPDGKWVVEREATCAEEGLEVQHCTVCGEAAESRSIDKLEHTPSKDWKTVREATCAEEGLRQKICTVCGGVAEEEKIEKADHNFGEWTILSGSYWDNPIVKERVCSVCGYVDHVESSPTSWLKPLLLVLFIIAFGGLVVILVTLKMNGLPLEPASIKKLFSKETLSDTDIEELINKKDDADE